MSIPIPSLPARVRLASFAYNFPNWSNTTPFSYQDGMTNVKLVESLIAYIDRTLVPYIDTEMLSIVDEWKSTVTALIDTIVGNAIEIQDPIVAQLIAELNSDTYAALNTFVSGLVIDSDEDGVFVLRDDTANPFKIIGAKSTGEPAGIVKTYLDGCYPLKTDVYTKAETDAKYPLKTDTYTKVEADAKYPLKTDTYTKAETDIKVSNLTAKMDARVLRGTYATRPLASAVDTDTIYVCTDIPEQYIAQANVWYVFGSGGNELAAAEYTGPLFSTAATVATNIPGFMTTFVAGERPVKIDLSIRIAASVSGAVVYAALFLDGVRVGFIESGSNMGADKWRTEYYQKRVSGLTPGSTHTVQVAVFATTGAGNGGNVLVSGDGTPCSLIVSTL